MTQAYALEKVIPSRDTLELLRMTLEAVPAGMLMVDADGQIVLANGHVERLFGYASGELSGLPIEVLIPERFRATHSSFRGGCFVTPSTRPTGRGPELCGLHKDGREIPIEIGLNSVVTADGTFVLSSVADITQRKSAERENQMLMAQLQQLNTELEARVVARTMELTGALREREVLLQEVHHRVKNNLQVISSLIGMKMRRLESGGSRDALEDCQLRVQAIALIHEKLSKSQDYDSLSFSEYARSLVSSILLLAEASSRTISLELAIEELTFCIERAIPCGLILNELVTNAMKHAFRDGRAGIIRVELGRSQDGLVFLVVKDNGVGLLSAASGSPDSMGLQLVSTLAEQLEARVEVRQDRGTEVRLCFALD